MNLEQLKKKLEPWIRSLIKNELNKKKSIGVVSTILDDNSMDQVVKNAKKALDLLKDFHANKKQNDFDGDDLEI